MSSGVDILNEVSHAIDLKSRNDVTQTNFNFKAVEVTEVIEKVKVIRNKNLLDEVKKKQQDKSWNKIQRSKLKT